MLKSMNELSKKFLFMRWILKRRRLVSIAIILCVCFLIYQLLSLKELNGQMSVSLVANRDNHKTSDHKTQSNLNNNNKPFVYSKNTLNINNNNLELNQIESKSNLNTNKLNEQIVVNNVILSGVLPKFLALYRKTSDSFRCLLSGEEIAYNYLNDNYCDCKDGTDEPSTNACPNNKFYCTTNSGKAEDYISSAKVNDGLCDCCDGSDEWLSLSAPLKLTASQIKTIKSSRRQVPTPPCPKRCH